MMHGVGGVSSLLVLWLKTYWSDVSLAILQPYLVVLNSGCCCVSPHINSALLWLVWYVLYRGNWLWMRGPEPLLDSGGLIDLCCTPSTRHLFLLLQTVMHFHLIITSFGTRRPQIFKCANLLSADQAWRIWPASPEHSALWDHHCKSNQRKLLIICGYHMAFISLRVWSFWNPPSVLEHCRFSCSFKGKNRLKSSL